MSGGSPFLQKRNRRRLICPIRFLALVGEFERA